MGFPKGAKSETGRLPRTATLSPHGPPAVATVAGDMYKESDDVLEWWRFQTYRPFRNGSKQLQAFSGSFSRGGGMEKEPQ